MAHKEKILLENDWLEAQGLTEDDIGFLQLLRNDKPKEKISRKSPVVGKPIVDWLGNKHYGLKETGMKKHGNKH